MDTNVDIVILKLREDQRAAMLSRVAGILSALLGFSVLLGWYTHNTTLLRVSPLFVAMAYNTALGFFLAGLGMIASEISPSRPLLFVKLFTGTAILLLGILTLSEYLVGVNLGIDQLFMHSYLRSGVTAPGRMAFCTALCFALIGVSELMGQARAFSLRPLLTATIGSLVIGLGVIALSGYFTGIVASYTWGAFTRMAVHTAVGFLILGIGVIAYAWRDGCSRSQSTQWLPLFVGAGVITLTLCLWQGLVVEENAQSDLIRRLANQTPHYLGPLPRTQSLLPDGELISGLLLAVLMAGAVVLAQTARSQAKSLREVQEVLEKRVTERTKELAAANLALQKAAGWQRGFLRDALASVTDGKLRICDIPEDLPPLCESFFGSPILLSRGCGLSDLRCRTLEAAQICNFSLDRSQDLITAVNEAGMNAIVHGENGSARISFSSEGCVQVRVSDQGKGISMENLPRATLTRGFTTAGTLGHGLKMILQTTDRLWLLTGTSGTTVVLEQDRLPHESDSI